MQRVILYRFNEVNVYQFIVTLTDILISHIERELLSDFYNSFFVNATSNISFRATLYWFPSF